MFGNRRSAIVLSITCTIAVATIYSVHWQQQDERQVCSTLQLAPLL